VFGFTLDKDHKIVETQRAPILIPELKNITQISVGADYALALDKKGDVYGWGNGPQDQLGRRLIDRRRAEALLPKRIPIPHTKKIGSIFASSNHAFAIDTAGNTWAWGLNNFAQTGIDVGAGEDGGSITAPTKVPALAGLNMKMLSGGTHHSIASTQTGKTFVWGRLDGCQAGVDISKLPEEIVRRDDRGLARILLKPTLLPFSSAYVTAASEHNIAITPDGTAYSWGFNGNYQCGQGDEDEVKIATLIDNTAVRGKNLVWAGTGGQFSMFAAKSGDDAPVTNGVNGANGH
jgi:regulator of chromosome condensation